MSVCVTPRRAPVSGVVRVVCLCALQQSSHDTFLSLPLSYVQQQQSPFVADFVAYVAAELRELLAKDDSQAQIDSMARAALVRRHRRGLFVLPHETSELCKMANQSVKFDKSYTCTIGGSWMLFRWAMDDRRADVGS